MRNLDRPACEQRRLPIPCAALAIAILVVSVEARGEQNVADWPPRPAAGSIRWATFNVSLYDENQGEVFARLSQPGDKQASCLAEIIQRVRPDVLLVNEVDYAPDQAVIRAFCENYLAKPQHVSQCPDGPGEPLNYAYRYVASTNTGEPSGFDLDRNGVVENDPKGDAYGGDCWGFGRYPGQYAFAVLSHWPIDIERVRTFQKFPWAKMPQALLPDDPATPAPADWYSADALARFRLSSKNHVDLPLRIGARTIHLLAAHPTPPTYDGPENRNGRRNHDEIRLWCDYVGPAAEAAYLVDDAGRAGGLAEGASFVIAGDLNSDPHDGEGSASINRLLASPRVARHDPPTSPGGAEQAARQGGANARHKGDPAQDTCDPADDPGPGNLRLDYVLPSADLTVTGCGVFWPRRDDPLFKLVGEYPFPSSDHRCVWLDVAIGETGPPR